MGYRVNSECYGSTASALEGFNANWPVHEGGNTLFLSSSSINATGLITFTEKNQLGTTTINAKALQLQTCSYTAMGTQPSLNDGLIQHMRFAQSEAAVIFFLFLFILGAFAGYGVANPKKSGGV